MFSRFDKSKSRSSALRETKAEEPTAEAAEPVNLRRDLALSSAQSSKRFDFKRKSRFAEFFEPVKMSAAAQGRARRRS